jgi:VWFA-related protein
VRSFLAALLCVWALSPLAISPSRSESARIGEPAAVSAQEQPPVFRANTELVQTDVMVFDRDERFVDGLRLEDFELRVDGQVRQIAFFERVAAGTADEEAQLSAAGGAASSSSGGVDRPGLDRGRTVLFYVDDVHMDVGSLNLTLKTIAAFIDTQMSQDDQVVIASASGQVGFLQQLTDNKMVLHRALQRIKPIPARFRDTDRPTITEYQALRVDTFDREITDVLVGETIRLNPFVTREQAESLVRGRSRLILQHAGQSTGNTLSGLEGLVGLSSKVPGRKVLFFLSGGFILDPDQTAAVRAITSAAAKSGTIVYSIDARGLVASVGDAGVSVSPDATVRLGQAAFGELTATQDGLYALARETGGRPIFNTNAIDAGLSRALDETAVYYLLAWQPDRETGKARRFRNIDVSLKGKPDLTVRVRRGFFETGPAPVAPVAKPPGRRRAAQVPDTPLQQALGSPFPERAIPIALSVNYLFTADRRMMLITSMQVPHAFLSFRESEAKQHATVRIGGTVFNERGQAGARFNQTVAVTTDPPDPLDASADTFSYTHQIFAEPGFYQVHVAAHDEASGRIGSAHAWIEIPDLATPRLALSSLLIGTPRTPDEGETPAEAQAVTASLHIGRRFQYGSTLRVFVFAYNAVRAASDGPPDIAIQFEIVRDNRAVVTIPYRRMAAAAGDLGGVPYAADVSLAGLNYGRYVLRVSVIDRVANAAVAQEARFEIE